MKYRPFGNTGLRVSEIGFGAWAIGGPAIVGGMAIGWGKTDDEESIAAIRQALDMGINFFDTADFYGLGHSESLLGRELKKEPEVIIASKVGHRKSPEDKIVLDYSYDYIIGACEASLRRLQRDHIDYYQLHTAKVSDLETGACVRAMQTLEKEGKIRYWGISLNTFNPFPEAEWMLEKQWASGFQLVLNLINQTSLPVVTQAEAAGLGVIARMPLQFGLLTGKIKPDRVFEATDHRSFRLTPEIIRITDTVLTPVWELTEKYGTTRLGISLSYILSYSGVSTVIPGLRTREQVLENTCGIVTLEDDDRSMIEGLFEEIKETLLPLMKAAG